MTKEMCVELLIKSLALFSIFFISARDVHAGAGKKVMEQPAPTVANFAYGNDSEGQVLDFWQAKSDQPTPVVVYFHGGGWQSGHKREWLGDIQPYLDAGISVGAANDRFIDQAMEQKVEPPVKACLYDAARAIQTLRLKAGPWNIDPIPRQSTRLARAAVDNAQTSLDPKELREWIPGAIYGLHAFGYAAKGRKRAEE